MRRDAVQRRRGAAWSHHVTSHVTGFNGADAGSLFPGVLHGVQQVLGVHGQDVRRLQHPLKQQGRLSVPRKTRLDRT